MSVESSTAIETTDELTRQNIWTRRDELIDRAFEQPEASVLEALPATGKSRGSIEWASRTGNPLTVLAPRHNLLDNEYEPWCDEFGLNPYRLPSFYRDCPSIDDEGNPVDETAEALKAEYEQDYPVEEVHENHPESACQEDGPCPYIEALSFDPDSYDVLLGTYRHAHVEEWIEDRYVVFDEFPGDDFLKTFGGDIASVISAYPDDEDELPFSSYRDLQLRRGDDSLQGEIVAWKDSLPSSLYDSSHPRRSPITSAHPLAPLATLAVIEMKPLENKWYYADLGEGRKAVLNPLDDNWTFLLPPGLSSAESVVGLDGTPNPALWRLALDEPVQTIELMGPAEKREYLRDVLGLEFVQTTKNWKPMQSGRGAAPPKDLALIEGIARREDSTPALISSRKAIAEYRDYGLNELTEKVEHYGNLKGMNKFADERLGIILGNPHPGDEEIQLWSAFAGVSASRRSVEGEELSGKATDYGPYGNSVMRTMVHNEVLQAAMRFGRQESNGERGATVYIHTCAIPDWISVKKRIPEVQSWTTGKQGMKDVIEAIKSLEGWRDDEWRATALYDYTSIGERQVRDCLEDLADAGYIECCGKKGRGNALHYSNDHLDKAGTFGHVEFAG